MKRFVLIFFVVFPLALFAQKTSRIAVMEPIKVTAEVTVMQCQIVRGGLETAAVNASGYDVYDRASFDVILREQNIQVSSAISELQIKKIGELAGVQYVVVSEITAEGDDFYILVKMFDVEKGKYGTVYEKLCGKSSAEIKNVCAELGDSLFVGGVSDNSNVEKSEKSKKDYTETAFDLDMRMIYVEGGTFMMGCTDEQGSDCDEDEKNVRRVTVDGFYIGMLEVTQSQWDKVFEKKEFEDYYESDTKLSMWYIVGDESYEEETKEALEYGYNIGDTVFAPLWGGCRLNRFGSNYPVCCVDYHSAMEFCRILSERTGKKYTLPTEAQWEYAARGGQMSMDEKYAGSNSIEDVGWYNDNSDKSIHIGGTLRSNELGIYDMSGNVSEWCRDSYIDSYLSYDVINPEGPNDEFEYIVIRGGDFMSKSTYCRVSARGYGYYAIILPEGVGFRVVCIP